MSEHTPRMNRLLIFVAVFLCLICGILFTQSSAGPFESSSTSVVSINTSDISTIEPSSDRDHHTDASISSGAPSPSATPSPVSTEIPETEKVSPEAENGVWTPDGTNWKFMVDGTAYTGWLTDTDGHRYYFNKDGIMQTGWITLGKKTLLSGRRRNHADRNHHRKWKKILIGSRRFTQKMIFRYIRATKMQVLPEPAFY